MSFLDDAKKKLTKAVGQHGDKISQGIDKAAAAANQRTGGKHGDKIGKASLKAKQAMANLDKGDGSPGGTGPTGTGPTGTGPTGPTDPRP